MFEASFVLFSAVLKGSCCLSFKVSRESMSDECINQYFDSNVTIKGDKVVAVEPPKMRFIESAMTFFSTLCVVSYCHVCFKGHFKYGLHVKSNLPCVLDKHDEDGVVYYIPFSSKITQPLRIPAVGDTLINGIRWNTTTPRDKQVAVVNSCMLDGFLTDLKMRSLDVKFCFECLFNHASGAGKDLEQCLRTLISHITISARPITQSKYVRIRSFSYEEDLKVKRIWLDKDAFHLVPEYNSDTGSYEQNLLYRPKEGNPIWLIS